MSTTIQENHPALQDAKAKPNLRYLSWVLFQIALITLQFGTRAAFCKSKSLASLVLLSRCGTCHSTRIVRQPVMQHARHSSVGTNNGAT